MLPALPPLLQQISFEWITPVDRSDFQTSTGARTRTHLSDGQPLFGRNIGTSFQVHTSFPDQASYQKPRHRTGGSSYFDTSTQDIVENISTTLPELEPN